MVTRRLGARKGEKNVQLNNFSCTESEAWLGVVRNWMGDGFTLITVNLFFLSFSYFFHTVKPLYKDKNFFFSFSPKNIDFRPDLPRNLPFLRCVPQMYDFSVQGGVFDVQP